MKRWLMVIAAAWAMPAAADELDPAEVEFFESKIRPILVQHCYECHSEQADASEAGLVLDSRGGWQHGGDSGAAIVPGDVEGSLLIDAVRYTENVVSGMPPTSKLPPEQIDALEKWVAMGAPDPRDSGSRAMDAKRAGFDWQSRFDGHWSWRPIAKPDVPSINDEDGKVIAPIDAFVRAPLAVRGLRAAPPADRSTLIRRLSLDLIGLPPTPGEISDYVDDDSPGATERLVDRLLGSPHFGEKWARHWMDLTRYADTYGHEFDYPIDHAHQYRDYLIRAFNDDVSYDQLIREHLAGDLIETPRRSETSGWNESVIGTGFWYLHEATHAPTDVLAHESAIIDNQIDVMSKTFLGLTVACARCHDHKFDAISTDDYYALSAYLQNSCRVDYPLDTDGEVESSTRKIVQLLDEASRSITLPIDEERLPPDTDTTVHFSGDDLPPGWSQTGTAFRSAGRTPRWGVDGTMMMPGTVDSGALGLRQVGTLRSPTFTIDSPKIHVRMKSSGPVMMRVVIDHFEMTKFHQLLFGGTMLRNKQLESKGKNNQDPWQWQTLGGDLIKYQGHQAYLEWVDSGNGSVAIDQVVFAANRGPDGPSEELNHAVTVGTEAAELVSQAKALADRLPDPTWAIAMAQGTRLGTPIYIRGGHTNLGDEVPPRNLSALGGEEGTRLDLANRIASIDNPLAARVMVNRLWHHLFGVGIVSTTDDFGPQGQPPTHPELLDWLANDFARSGWSIKRMVRQMVLSQTYRQSSVADPGLSRQTIQAADPTNQWLHRSRVRRLPGESIRDAMMMISGRLDRTAFGPGVATHRTAFMQGRGGRPSGPLDGEGRRSVYLSVYRNFLNPFFLVFDMPSPFGPQGRRGRSNVPAQSLTMMNDPMVWQEAKRWSQHEATLEPAESVSARLGRMWSRSLGKPPTPDQHQRLVTFLVVQSQSYQGIESESDSDSQRSSDSLPAAEIDPRAWIDLAHAIWNVKAFTFVR